MKIHIFALAALGDGLSGGDRIFIELSRRWSKKVAVDIYVWEEGAEMIKRQKLTGKNLNIHVIKVGELQKLGFIFTYFYRVYLGILLGLKVNLDGGKNILYPASEFWMDLLPAFILKLRFKKALWVQSWYQTAPNPLKGFNETDSGVRSPFKAFLYWFVQLSMKPLVERYSDIVLVNNEDEKKRFKKHRDEDRIQIMFGAIDLDRINTYKKNHKLLHSKYDAVFQGRFHPQKGVVELVDIWQIVLKRIPNARLAMIGDGPLMEVIKAEIAKNKLNKNIELFGYVYDGDKKYKIFSESKLVVHPAYYDSGGMASAEAMAFDIPCVGFDLVSYKSYYPKGMVKVNGGDKKAFANAVVELLENKKKYTKYKKEAMDLIQKNWSWDTRSRDILNELNKYYGHISSNI